MTDDAMGIRFANSGEISQPQFGGGIGPGLQLDRSEVNLTRFNRAARSSRVARHARDLVYLLRYHRYLENGVEVWLSSKRKHPLPPLVIRDGFTWHHGSWDAPDLLFREVYLERFYDQLDAPHGAHVLDIGANIGAVSLFWAQGRPDLHFHAYEPNPDAFATLRENVDGNSLGSQFHIHPEAIGRERGELNLWVDGDTTLSTAYGTAPFEGARKQAVPMITLDDAWERMGRAPIWMLKIDTEGAEGDILEGASEAMLASVSTACIEWHNNIVPGVFDRCRDRLIQAGFTFRTREHPWDEGIIYASR